MADALQAEVVFLGELTDGALWQEYAECRALLFAADEDFGMVPLGGPGLWPAGDRVRCGWVSRDRAAERARCTDRGLF